MKGLLAKDFYMMLKTNSLLWYIVIIAFYTVCLSISMESMLIISLILVITIPTTSISYDELSHWQQYSLALPYSRKQIVTSKYIFTILIELLFAVVGAILIGVDMIKQNEFRADQLVCFISMMMFMGAIYPTFALPFNFLLGTSKARFVLIAFMAFTFAAVFSLAPQLRDFSTLEKLVDNNAYLLSAIILAVESVMLLVSWYISVKIYEKKEF